MISDEAHMPDPLPDVETRTPRWVKVAGILALALVALIVIGVLIGRHDGPSRHGASENQRQDSPQLR